MPNRLINETSPYLLQHSDNPVNWFPWSNEALEIAQSEDKPIFLSVGYSACHWCHVMAEESFSDQTIADLLNENFVSIKVDREERPDIDSIYMDAVQAISGQGGWPLTVFLTPQGVPFFGGTYYPPEDRQGMPGFPKVIASVLDAFNNRRSQIDDAGNRIIEHLENSSNFKSESIQQLGSDLVDKSYDKIKGSYDANNGGFGTMPKFPQVPLLEFLLRYSDTRNSDEALEMVTHTLDSMGSGGIHDQIQGGFHRYSTDANWVMPHFEKMLYDNALIANIYLNAHKATGNPIYAQICQTTLEFVIENMRSNEGSFYSSIDADSNHIEGDYYLWSKKEILEALGSEQSEDFGNYFSIGLTNSIDSEDRSTIIANNNLMYHPLKESQADSSSSLNRIIDTLLSKRAERTKPDIDTKTLSSWNGLMLRVLAEAGAAFQNDLFLENAKVLANLMKSRTNNQNGRLSHTYNDDEPGEEGFLEDYGFTINAFISMFETDHAKEWLDTAVELANSMIKDYWDPEAEMFYDTSSSSDALIVKPRNILDNAIPCGNSSSVEGLLRLATIIGDMEYRDIAEKAILGVSEHMTNYPAALAHWLNCLDYYSGQPKEIVVIGDKDNELTLDLIQVVHSLFIPNKVVVVTDPTSLVEWDHLPLMDAKVAINGLPTAYVCENYACKLPTHSVSDFREQLSLKGTSLNIASLVDFHNQGNMET